MRENQRQTFHGCSRQKTDPLNFQPSAFTKFPQVQRIVSAYFKEFCVMRSQAKQSQVKELSVKVVYSH